MDHRIPPLAAAIILCIAASPLEAQNRPRARDIGLTVGVFPTGQHNAITDVGGVLVGQTTIVEGDSVNTGVTAILPHAGNVFRDRVPAAVHVFNGFGKMLGIAQVRENGELETPILLTCTLCVWRAADALVGDLLAGDDMRDVRSINVVVGETNDGFLNDIRARPIRPEHVTSAVTSARTGPVDEGSVGAGRGTMAFGWKGGIGTSSRRVPARVLAGAYTVGVLVQSNFGGLLSIAGAPITREIGPHRFRDTAGVRGDAGSIMIVVATDAPLSPPQLERLARRATFGLARTGSSADEGSGDFVIAFSTHPDVRRRSRADGAPLRRAELDNTALNPLFQAVIEATEEAIYNSLFRATPVSYRGRVVEALPVDRVVGILRQHGIVRE